MQMFPIYTDTIIVSVHWQELQEQILVAAASGI